MSVFTKDVRFEEAHQDGIEVKSMCEVLDGADITAEDFHKKMNEM